jgi:tetratricopeptide (TPR) repeat protein
MGVLTRPDLPPGAGRDLVEALHDLHHRAGRPSLRTIAGHVGCSPTTVSAVFSSSRLPTWGVLELVVESLGGDVQQFRTLWLAADADVAEGGRGLVATIRLAGRKDELRVVRRHLAGGRGLLLVSGEAGIGKSHLVRAATSAVDGEVFVAVGACLPLSTAVPLLPVSDALRTVHAVDGGRWVGEALAGTARYVADSLAPLLPELDAEPARTPRDDAWSRHRQSLAVGAVLAALADRRPLAVVLEDLHWADAATLDLLEHLLTRGAGAPLVGTWRSEDPTTPEASLDWLLRMTRLPDVATLPLGPLTEDETAEQLDLLGAGTTAADRIHRRSGGQPLFTEQLAAWPEESALPRLLADLLDRRLAGLPEPALSVARVLGVADRATDADLLGRVTGLDPETLAGALHDLADHRLLQPGSLVELRHPLLAEAVRRSLVPPETRELHRRVATALAGAASTSPAEVAEHWRLAEDDSEELTWRIAAARAATQRFAIAQAADEWRRALALWPEGVEQAGSPSMSKQEVYVAAMEVLCFLDVEAGSVVAEAAVGELGDPVGLEAAETYRRAAYIRCWQGDAEGALALVERGLAIHAGREPSIGYLDVLNAHGMVLDALGRHDEARISTAQAREMAARLDVPRTYRSMLIQHADHESDLGHADRALALLVEARDAPLDEPDPEGDIYLAVTSTDLMTQMGRPIEEIVDAGRRGLESARAWGIETRPFLMTCANMAAALRLAGQVERAAALIDPLVADHALTPESSPVHWERVWIDAARGRCGEALARLDLVNGLEDGLLYNRLENARYTAEGLLWCGRPDEAFTVLAVALEGALPTDAATVCAAPLMLAARAAADLADHHADDHRTVRADELLRQRTLARQDPFTERPGYAAAAAEEAGWHAERARLTRSARVEHWVDVAHRWDLLRRPHDAAYCRWRGAQVAVAHGQGTLARRLLRRAAADALEHVPLSRSIDETARRTYPG